MQARIIAFDQVASHDEAAAQGSLFGAGKPSRPEPKGRNAQEPKGRAASRAKRKGK